MTPQLIPLLLSPLLLAINLYAIIVGRRGATTFHRASRIFGVAGICLFVAAIVVLVDLATQIWAMSADSISAELYVFFGAGFILCTLVSLVLISSLSGQERA